MFEVALHQASKTAESTQQAVRVAGARHGEAINAVATAACKDALHLALCAKGYVTGFARGLVRRTR